MHYIVYNPMAGRGRARRALAVTEAYFAECAMPHRVLTTTRRGHAAGLVHSLPHDAVILAVGGDGTAHEVAGGCIGTDRVLGVIPSGTGDDFAFALGLSRTDVPAALEKVRAGRVRAVDAGIVNGEVFVNAVGIGFDADVAAQVHEAPVLLEGVGAYLYAVAVALRDFAMAHAHVEIDGRTVHDGPALLVSAQNGPRTGGSFLFAPEAEVDDGLLDVLIAGRFTRASAMAMLPRLMKGQHLDHPEVRLVRGRDVRVSWALARPYHMEGEMAGPERVFEIRVHPRALRVLA